jgi:hypothetical protein
MTDRLHIQMRTNKQILKSLNIEKLLELINNKQLSNRYHFLEEENHSLFK